MRLHRIGAYANPPADQYVLIKVRKRPWMTKEEEEGVSWKVAKCLYKFEDRNRRPFYFSEFGGGDYLEEEVDAWCELPSEDEGTKTQEGKMHTLAVVLLLYHGVYIVSYELYKRRPLINVFMADSECAGATRNEPVGEISVWQMSDLIEHDLIKPVG